jgi:hypothetical protein
MAGRVNNGVYKQMENRIRDVLTEHKDWKAYVVINYFYPDPYMCLGGSFRPTGGKFVFYVVKPGPPNRRRIATLYWKNTDEP